jgi:hypothetical protein
LFGLDPDKVFYTPFNGIINLLEEAKERREYQERFNEIWGAIHDDTGSDTRGTPSDGA